MNEFQAAMGLINLRYVDEQINNRKDIANIYRENLKVIDGIYMVEDMLDIKHNYAYFPILINEEKAKITRDELYNKLQEYNVFTRKYFYPLITDFDCYNYEDIHLHNSKYISNRILTLPIYGQLDLEDALNITEIIKKIIFDAKK
jgi:dTDP-4-amino-4,6-dideoxygalactose transaminase